MANMSKKLDSKTVLNVYIILRGLEPHMAVFRDYSCLALSLEITRCRFRDKHPTHYAIAPVTWNVYIFYFAFWTRCGCCLGLFLVLCPGVIHAGAHRANNPVIELGSTTCKTSTLPIKFSLLLPECCQLPICVCHRPWQV